MAGSPWTRDEEVYFWTHVVPFSRRRKGIHIANPEYTWGELGARMQLAMGDKAKRTYTYQTMEEHFHLNVKTGRISKNAGKYVRAYKALEDKYPYTPRRRRPAAKNARQSTPSIPDQDVTAPGERSRLAIPDVDEADVTHAATKSGAEPDWEMGGDENMLKREYYQGVGEEKIAVAKGEDLAESCHAYCISGGQSHMGPEAASTTAGDSSVVSVATEASPAATVDSGTSPNPSATTEASFPVSVGEAPAAVEDAHSLAARALSELRTYRRPTAVMVPDVVARPYGVEGRAADEDDVMMDIA